MEILERLLAIAFSLSILGLGMLIRRVSGSWATPAALFCGFWFIFSFVPLLALYYVPINPLTLAYLLFSCLAFSLPSFGMEWRTALRRNNRHALQRGDYLDTPLIRTVFAISFVMSVLFILLDLLEQGISLNALFADFFETSNSYLAMRYEGDIKSNLFGQWGLICGYLCVTFGGLVLAHSRQSGWRRHLLLAIVMIPPILIMLAQSAKGFFFLAVAIVLGAHLVHRILTDARPYVDFAGLAKQSKYLIVAAPLVFVSFLTRGLYTIDDSELLQQRLTNYIASYAFLHLYAFSDWFSFTIGQPALQSYQHEPLTLGYYTFIALFKLLGSTKTVPPGTYGEYFSFADLSPGNIYTVFRGLIADFGISGSLFALFVAGAVFNGAYRHALTTRFPAFCIAMLFLFVNFLYSSYLISALTYNAAYLVFLLNVMLFFTNRHFTIARTRARRQAQKPRSTPPAWLLS